MKEKSHPQRNSAEDRLDGWKEISAYLRCDVKTCMRWERELDLPIIRLNPESKRSKVFAFKQTLDEWMAKKAEKASQRSRPSQKSALLFLGKAGFIIVLAFSVYLILRPKLTPLRQDPSLAEIQGRTFSVFDSDHRRMWGRTIPASGDNESYYQNSDYITGGGRTISMRRPKSVVFDADRDGLNEIAAFWNYDDPGRRSVILFDHDGSPLWENKVEFRTRYAKGEWGNNFKLIQIGAEDIDLDGRPEILALWHHVKNAPSVFQVFSSDGEMRCRYEHTGVLQVFSVRYLRDRKGTEILLGGTNNLLGGDAALIGIDGADLVSGLGPPYSVPEDLRSRAVELGQFIPKDYTPATQKYYIRIKKNEISRAAGMQWINAIQLTPSSTSITIGVDFADGDFLNYHFDETNRLFDLSAGSDFIRDFPRWNASRIVADSIETFLRQCALDVSSWDGRGWVPLSVASDSISSSRTQIK